MSGETRVFHIHSNTTFYLVNRKKEKHPVQNVLMNSKRKFTFIDEDLFLIGMV